MPATTAPHKGTQFIFRLSHVERQALMKHAQEQGKTASAVVRELLHREGLPITP
jgi:hypothetical protein